MQADGVMRNYHRHESPVKGEIGMIMLQNGLGVQFHSRFNPNPPPSPEEMAPYGAGIGGFIGDVVLAIPDC